MSSALAKFYLKGALTKFKIQTKNLLSNTSKTTLPLTLNFIDLKNSLNNLCVNSQVKFLTECILNVLNNFVPSKTIIYKEKDAPWMTNELF